MNDKHINPGETAVLISAADAASTEKKAPPACTIRYAAIPHPYDNGKAIVSLVGLWADGKTGGLPERVADRVKDFRPGGGSYFSWGGHAEVGRIMCVAKGERLDNVMAWLAQGKAWCEANIPQVPKPATDGKSSKPAVGPTW